MSIGQLAVASPTRPLAQSFYSGLFRVDAGWNLQMPGQCDNKPLLICS